MLAVVDAATRPYLEGPSHLYIASAHAKLIDAATSDRIVHETVKVRPWRGSPIEVISSNDEFETI